MKTTHGHETTVAEETGSAVIQPRHRTVSPRLAVDDSSVNYGVLLRQAAAVGYTVYSFCSERGVWPCTPAQSPLLTVWYH